MPRAGWWARAVPAAIFWFLAYIYLTVPDVRLLANENPSSTAFMELREAEARREHKELRHLYRWTPYARISGNLKRAVLVAEDSAFWDHEGIDFEQIKESMEVNWERMEFARGASTITQQLAKNLYLSPSRNPVRKVRELLITRRLEAVLSKRRILEIYLNVIEWGDGIWGAEAASRAYFRQSAASLSADEAALLAGAIINPRVLNPGDPTPRLRRRQRLLMRRMGGVTPPPDPLVVAAPPPEPSLAPSPELSLPFDQPLEPAREPPDDSGQPPDAPTGPTEAQPSTPSSSSSEDPGELTSRASAPISSAWSMPLVALLDDSVHGRPDRLDPRRGDPRRRTLVYRRVAAARVCAIRPHGSCGCLRHLSQPESAEQRAGLLFLA
jgi:monofunctional biosynthetic peptidoglycan transglycosylase